MNNGLSGFFHSDWNIHCSLDKVFDILFEEAQVQCFGAQPWNSLPGNFTYVKLYCTNVSSDQFDKAFARKTNEHQQILVKK